MLRLGKTPCAPGARRWHLPPVAAARPRTRLLHLTLTRTTSRCALRGCVRASLSLSPTHSITLFLSFSLSRLPRAHTWQEMKEFHSEEYIDFLLRITPDNMHEMADRMKQHNVGFVGQYDCPVFDGIFPFCQIFTGGSLDGAHRLIDGSADIAINWSGGYVP